MSTACAITTSQSLTLNPLAHRSRIGPGIIGVGIGSPQIEGLSFVNRPKTVGTFFALNIHEVLVIGSVEFPIRPRSPLTCYVQIETGCLPELCKYINRFFRGSNGSEALSFQSSTSRL